jgi:hypothetical protein
MVAIVRAALYQRPRQSVVVSAPEFFCALSSTSTIERMESIFERGRLFARSRSSRPVLPQLFTMSLRSLIGRQDIFAGI